MCSAELQRAAGKFLADLHGASCQYTLDHPEEAAKFEESKFRGEDSETLLKHYDKTPQTWGICHCKVRLNNLIYDPD